MNQSTTANDKWEPTTNETWPGIGVVPIDPRHRTYLVSQGWECPRCQKINNPCLDQCPCLPIGVSPVTTQVSKGTGAMPPVNFCTGNPWNPDDYVGLLGFVHEDECCMEDEEER